MKCESCGQAVCDKAKDEPTVYMVRLFTKEDPLLGSFKIVTVNSFRATGIVRDLRRDIERGDHKNITKVECEVYRDCEYAETIDGFVVKRETEEVTRTVATVKTYGLAHPSDIE